MYNIVAMFAFHNYGNAYRSRYLPLLFLSAITLVQLALLTGLYITSGNLSTNGMSPELIGRKGLIVLSFAELLFIAMVTPIILCLSHTFCNRTGMKILLVSSPRIKKMKRNEILHAFSAATVLSLTSIVPGLYLCLWKVPVYTVMKLVITLAITGYFLSSIYLFARSLCRDTFAAVSVTYLTLFVLVGSIMLMNPLIEWVRNPEPLAWITLLLNPLVATALSIDIDILRTDPLYYLSAISSFKFHYPSLYQYWISYNLVSFVLCIINRKYLPEKI